MARGAVGSTVFFLVAPGVMGGLVPWLVTGWDVGSDARLPLQVVGGLLLTAGVGVLVAAFRQFVVEGLGTPAPLAPTEHLVVGGLYRWVRNPMYVSLYAVIGGEALVFASLGLAWWLLIFFAATWSFVTLYEQPTLRERYGSEYDDFCAAVPGWWPRLSPYRPEREQSRSRPMAGS